MLKYVEDGEVLKVSTRELKEQVLSPDESSVSIVRIARQARVEKSKKLSTRVLEEHRTPCILAHGQSP